MYKSVFTTETLRLVKTDMRFQVKF